MKTVMNTSAFSGFKIRVGVAIDRSVVAIFRYLNPNFNSDTPLGIFAQDSKNLVAYHIISSDRLFLLCSADMLRKLKRVPIFNFSSKDSFREVMKKFTM